MKLPARVVKLNADHRLCEAVTDNQIKVVFQLSNISDVALSDSLELDLQSLDKPQRVTNVTRQIVFDACIHSHDVHDLKLPIRHEGSRFPSVDRLRGAP